VKAEKIVARFYSVGTEDVARPGVISPFDSVVRYFGSRKYLARSPCKPDSGAADDEASFVDAGIIRGDLEPLSNESVDSNEGVVVGSEHEIEVMIDHPSAYCTHLEREVDVTFLDIKFLAGEELRSNILVSLSVFEPSVSNRLLAEVGAVYLKTANPVLPNFPPLLFLHYSEGGVVENVVGEDGD
jgi:hypothetical protein